MDNTTFALRAQQLKPWLVDQYQTFHRHPELSGEEFETCHRIKRLLREMEIEPDESYAEPAVVAIIEGSSNVHTAAIRADIDALPIQEESGVSFASENPGVMHACGHDSHVTMLLGAAKILNEQRESLPGRVVFIFQPSEEKQPSGAFTLIRQGVLDNLNIEIVFGQHVKPHIDVGDMGVKKGSFMAASDDFTICIEGHGCHGAHPEQGIDAVVIASQVVLALQTVVSRFTDPVCPIVLSIGTIHGGRKANIMAESVVMEGTLRTLSESIREAAHTQMERIVADTASAFGGSGSIQFQEGYPVLSNKPELVEMIKRSASAVIGESHVFDIKDPSMGGEDFAYYQQYRPGIYTNLGCGNDKDNIRAPIHTSKFRIDTECLPLGSAIMAQGVWDYLEQVKE